MQTNEMCRKSCPILQISYMYEIQIFILIIYCQIMKGEQRDSERTELAREPWRECGGGGEGGGERKTEDTERKGI